MSAGKKWLALSLSIVLMFCTCLSGTTLRVAAATTDNYGEYFGKTDGSEAIGRADTFTESWENGLDLDKWEVVKFNNDWVSDFQVVDDPLGDEQGKVLRINRRGVWLVPTDEYYPSGALWGELKTITFRLYIKDLDSWINGLSKQEGDYYVPGISFRALTDDETGETLCRRVDGFKVYTGIDTGKQVKKDIFAAYGTSINRLDNLNSWKYNNPSYAIASQNYTEGFEYRGWMDVKIEVDSKGYATAFFTDGEGNTFIAPGGTFNLSGGKLALGCVQEEFKYNSELSTMNWSKEIYIDDIRATFQPSDFDKNEDAGDVNVYYEGNVFLNKGDTISLTGEQLGDTVLSAQIAKLSDDAVNIEQAGYVCETQYDRYYDVDADELWSKLNKSVVMNSTEEDGPFSIQQRSTAGLNMNIPETLGDGVYALLLEATDESYDNELVLINNPQITLLMGNDGDYATTDGWLKLGGENLSVQDKADCVSAIILDEDGNKLHLIQNAEGNERIYVDTTISNGVENENYMQVFLDDLNLEPGNYQIMVHNGYGGQYGWSVPFGFRVEEKAANTEWKEKGVFNVQEYGAVGDGNANDTAAIQRAINAAVENEGGVVYFPKHEDGATGFYRVTNGLIVAENVSFIGDGASSSKLFFDGYLKTEKNQTEYFISYERNFEITGLELYCNTNYFKTVIKNNDARTDGGKLYVHDVKFSFSVSAWRSDTFTACVPDIDGKSASEMYEAEWALDRFVIIGSGGHVEDFVLYDNVDYDGVLGGGGASDAQVSGKATYVTRLLETKYFDVNGLYGNKYLENFAPKIAGFSTDCNVQWTTANTVFRNITALNRKDNNRELFLADTGSLSSYSAKMRYIDPQSFQTDLQVLLSEFGEDEHNNLSKYATDNLGKTFYCSEKLTVGDTIVVAYGQGVGQIRQIVDIKPIGDKYFVVVNEAFACNPNRNSMIIVGYKVRNLYVNGGTFENGSYMGLYGTSWNTVFNNCTLRNVGRAAYQTAYRGFHWYGSMKNFDVDDVSYVHNDIAGDSGAYTPLFFLTSGETAGGVDFLGMRFSDSKLSMNDGTIGVTAGASKQKYNCSGTVVEDIEVICQTPTLSLPGTFEGAVVRRVHQYTQATNKSYSEIGPYTSYSNARTALKDGKLWADNLVPEWLKLPGDINEDDFVNLADLTMLRKYLAGTQEFTDDQIKVANLNNDYVDSKRLVDARDFLYLRALILIDDADELQKAITAIGVTGTTSSGTGGSNVPDLPVYNDIKEGLHLDYQKTEEED